MTHPIIEKIVKQGVASVDVSMLSADARFKLMTEAGNKLLHMKRFVEAAEAFAIAENYDELRAHGKWFMQQLRPGVAAYFLLHVQDEEQLNELARACIASNDIDSAQAVYKKLGDTAMIEFINENLRITK